MVNICERFSLLGKTVWLHSSCARVLGIALLEIVNRELSP